MRDEEALIQRAARGDSDALEALAVAHRPPVYRTAVFILGEAEAAQDVTQEVFVRMQVSLPSFRGDCDLSTWLYRLTLNLCRDELRRARWIRSRRSDEESVDRFEAAETNPERDIDLRRARAAVRAAIERLPADQRDAVKLRFLSDLPYDDIARITGTPPGTVASRVFRALKRLGEELEPNHMEVLK